MQMYMPTRVYSEENCVTKHARDLGAFGKKAMIVTGRHSAVKCGALADVQAAAVSLSMTEKNWQKREARHSMV